MIKFQISEEIGHCNVCGARNHGTEPVDIFELTFGHTAMNHGFMLCKACAAQIVDVLISSLKLEKP